MPVVTRSKALDQIRDDTKLRRTFLLANELSHEEAILKEMDDIKYCVGKKDKKLEARIAYLRTEVMKILDIRQEAWSTVDCLAAEEGTNSQDEMLNRWGARIEELENRLRDFMKSPESIPTFARYNPTI